MNSKIETAIRGLQNVTPTSAGYTALCPSHPDRENSLSIYAGRDGRVHVHCHAGCGFKPVEAMGLTVDDLKGESVRPVMSSLKKKSREPRKKGTGELIADWNGLTLEQYAEAKRLDLRFLQSLGLSNTEYQEKPAVRMPYLNAKGEFVNARVRAAMSGKMKFRWEISGGETCLYGLWLAPKLWKPCGYAVIVEGESDCHTLWQFNIPAVGLPGATNWNDERDGALFTGVEIILVIIEPDAGGDAVERWLKERAPSIASRARLVHLSEDNKDPSTLYLQDPATFRIRLQAAFAQAIGSRR